MNASASPAPPRTIAPPPSRRQGAAAPPVLPALLLWALAGPLAAQEPRAVERAAGLLREGSTVEAVVRDVSTTFRLDPPGTARVLRAVELDAERAGAGLAGGMRLQPEALLTALLEGGFDEAAAARAGARQGLDARGAASVLRARGTDGERAVGALAEAYRLDVRGVATQLRAVDYPPDQAARGLRTLAGSGSEVIESMKAADFQPEVLREVTQRFFARTPEEYVAAMSAAGEPVEPVAGMLRNSYGLDAGTGSILLHPADPPHPYSGTDMTRALRISWELNAPDAFRILEAHPANFLDPWAVMEWAGYPPVDPEIHRYRIADHRPGHSGQQLENVGVVDGTRVSPGAPEPWDGEVEILLGQRGLEGVRATMGGREGELVAREAHDFTEGGIAVPGEWLRFRFTDFESGNLEVEHAGRTSSVGALALGYNVVDGEVFTGPLQALSVVLGSPPEAGQLIIPAGTYGGIPVPESRVDFEVPAHREAGIESSVVAMSSSTVTVSTGTLGPGTLRLDVEIAFEEEGAEVEGTFVEYVPCWSCGSFQVPQSTCAFGNWACFLSVLGGTLQSLGSCADAANWVESEMAAGPALPFEADLTDARLTLAITVGAQGGTIHVSPPGSLFSAGISLRTGPAQLPLGPLLQGWILGQVNDRLEDSVAAADIPGLLAGSMAALDATLGFGALRGIYRTSDGRWFFDSSY